MNSARFSILLMTLVSLTYMACDDDDMKTPITYASDCCVYGTMQRDDIGQRWEVVVDLETGAWDSIPETRRAATSFQLPIGVNRLNDFSGNRHLYTNLNGEDLIVQDLTTFEKTMIPLNDPETGEKIDGSLFLEQGRGNNEYFLYSGIEERVYAIDLDSRTLSIALDTFSLEFDLLNDFVYSPSEDYFVFLGQINQGFTERLYTATIYDQTTKTLVARDTFPQRLFGFVADPDEAKMFALTFPENQFGYRLFEVRFLGEDGLSYTDLSTQNLAIGQLSEQLQTLHTATNSYLCYGESPPFKVIYQLNLDNGGLEAQIVLDDFGTMIKLDGE